MSALVLLLGCSGDGDKTPTTPGDPVDTDVSETTPPPDTDTTPASTGDTGPATDTAAVCAPGDEAEFGAMFAEKYCIGWEQCNTGGIECNPDGTTTGPPGSCDYNPVAAEACVCTDEWRWQHRLSGPRVRRPA